MNDEQVAWLAAAILCSGYKPGAAFEDGLIQPVADSFYAALTDHWLEDEAEAERAGGSA